MKRKLLLAGVILLFFREFHRENASFHFFFSQKQTEYGLKWYEPDLFRGYDKPAYRKSC